LYNGVKITVDANLFIIILTSITDITVHNCRSELQVMWWIQRLKGHIHTPLCTPTYPLLAKKLPYAVDYGTYMHAVARDINAAPSLWFLLRHGGARALLAYALGQSYISFFRIQGPFATAHALEVARTELWRPVLQRGLLSNAVFIALLIPFGVINAVAWLAEQVLVQYRATTATLVSEFALSALLRYGLTAAAHTMNSSSCSSNGSSDSSSGDAMLISVVATLSVIMLVFRHEGCEA
jgi:hypothetical protein